jgi:hypothetical protein
MEPSHRQEVEAILAGAHAEHRSLLEHVSPALRASLPVDATGITQAIEHLAQIAGVADDLAAEQAAAHRANPAVLHGRVFGRGAHLEQDTILAAFAAGAQVRAAQLVRLAEAVDGLPLRREVEALLGAAGEDLGDVFAAQEGAVLLCAERLDAIGA